MYSDSTTSSRHDLFASGGGGKCSAASSWCEPVLPRGGGGRVYRNAKGVDRAVTFCVSPVSLCGRVFFSAVRSLCDPVQTSLAVAVERLFSPAQQTLRPGTCRMHVHPYAADISAVNHPCVNKRFRCETQVPVSSIINTLLMLRSRFGIGPSLDIFRAESIMDRCSVDHFWSFCRIVCLIVGRGLAEMSGARALDRYCLQLVSIRVIAPLGYFGCRPISPGPLVKLCVSACFWRSACWQAACWAFSFSCQTR